MFLQLAWLSGKYIEVYYKRHSANGYSSQEAFEQKNIA
ncbi:hypothetical protein PALI_b0044 [Pseudoalteromonas aliena SW19]|uniref:Integrase catalytic domain-containing protein n=1 Tax=Pseudoalteromonas aliena SW19 TaxID=1314866 RepID=A0ABR9E3E7_9GAMM|nr:hypothetical protein [Pseudoalteromonas aliena SW19]